jgi:crotonobetainyl-CoA:carnitine CoA-transferase CaiB-like acyl-CoA transferase
MQTKQALEGLKVVELGTAAVGPFIGKYLADFGAEVIRIESSVHPDITRLTSPFKDGIPGLNRSSAFTQINTSKRSISIDFNHPKGCELGKRLMTWADVVIENFAPGVIEKWGLCYDELKKVKPDIIMLSASSQGQTGPCSKMVGFGFNLKGLTGFVHFTGWPDRTSVGPPLAYTDFVAPWFAVVAILAALDYRHRTGKGQYIDISQSEASLHFLSPAIMDYFANHRVQTPQGNWSPYAAPHGVYRCKGNDRWCAIAVFSDEEWHTFCAAMGDPPWTQDSKFATFLDRKENEAEMDKLVEQWTINSTPEELMNLLQSVGVPTSIVQNSEDLNDRCPQMKHRGYRPVVNHAEMGPHRHMGWPCILSETPLQLRPAPCLGQDNEYICTKILGMADQEFLELSESGVLR